MTLILTRVDYINIGVTSRGTTCVFATGEAKQPQKFAVADHDGILHIFGFKRGELQVIYKSLPRPKINRTVLGGIISLPKDKIFVAFGNTVIGYTKKGKIFLEFDTGLIEPITALYVLGSDLAACAQDLYHRYRDCKEADSYLIGEKIHDVILVPIETTTVLAILACSDCAIRVLHGKKKPTVLRLSSVPMVFSSYKEGNKESYDRILMGTIDGKVGLLLLENDKNLRISWILTKESSEITSLDSYEIQDSTDLIVGKQDGFIEVYTLPCDENTAPFLRFRYNAGESITSVIGGIISSIEYPEILVTTYSGKIFGLTTKPPGLLEIVQRESGITKLKIEIQQLEEIKNDYTRSLLSGDTLTPLIMSVNHRMVLNKEDVSYTFFMELDRSIDNILLQSNTPVELLDVEGNNAVMSLSICNPNEGNFILATYRCQDNTNRLEIKLRSIEGQPGTLQFYISSQIQPKCCRKILVPICALSLHTRLYSDNKQSILGGPFNKLRVTGKFSMAEMHAWLALALLDVPERPIIQEEDSEATMIYVSTFIGTILKCKYKKGDASFLSENISTIIILRDFLTEKATIKKIKLDVFCDIIEASISRVFELIFPQLKKINAIIEKIKILDALDMWEMKNISLDLCTKYQDLIKNEIDLRHQMSKYYDILKRLHAVVTDLYIDWKRAKGVHSKQASEDLHFALESMNMTLLLQAFVEKDITTTAISIPVL